MMSLIPKERVKLSANYLNAAAGACFTASVVAPVAAALFGIGAANIPTLTLALGVLIFFGASIGFHALGRYMLK